MKSWWNESDLAADGVRHVVEVAFAEDDAKLPIDLELGVSVTVFE